MNVAIMAQAVVHVHDCGDLCCLAVAVRLCISLVLYFVQRPSFGLLERPV